jgi:hypothetical protein
MAMEMDRELDGRESGSLILVRSESQHLESTDTRISFFGVTQIKKARSYTSTSPHAFMALFLIKDLKGFFLRFMTSLHKRLL